MGREISVLQFERLGDILMTVPMLKLLKKSFGNYKINIFLADKFKGILEGAEFVDNIVYVDSTEITGFGTKVEKLFATNSFEAEKGSLINEKTNRLLKIINNSEKVFNVSHDIYSTWLVKHSRCREKYGGIFSEDNRCIYLDIWNTYMGAFLTDFRNINRVHVSDLYRGMAGGKIIDKELYINVDNSYEIPNGDYVVLSPAASNMKRAWSVENFAKLCNLLGNNGIKTVLVGAGEDLKVCNDVYDFAETKPVNLGGKTSIPQLAAVVKGSIGVISHDTGTVHVAAAVKTPIVFMCSLPLSFFRETAPWSEGNFIIETENREGNGIDSIPPEFTIDCLMYLRNKVSLEVIKQKIDLNKNLKCYESVILNPEDGLGGLGFIPLNKENNNKSGYFADVFRIAFASAAIGTDAPAPKEKYSGIDYNTEIDLLKKMQRDFKWLGEDIIKAKRFLKEHGKNTEIINILKKMAEKESRIKSYSDKSELIKALTSTFSLTLAMITDDEIDAVLKKTENIYDVFGNITNSMLKYLC